VADGFRLLRRQPRGSGASTGPMRGLTLHDYAADIAAVIVYETVVSVIVVGQALGNHVGCSLAIDGPERVRGLVMAAASARRVPAGVTEKPISPAISAGRKRNGGPISSEPSSRRATIRAFASVAAIRQRMMPKRRRR
jgi:pimeloyl-ACP methyl ester carboxylesterase